VTIKQSVTVTEIRGGIAARASEIGLAGHGRDQERALDALRSVVAIWARCLADEGELKRTLARRGVASSEGNGALRIELTLDGVSA
jgi:hypothetical protein